MKLLLQTHSTNEFADGCDYAHVELTTPLIQNILRRAALFTEIHKRDSGILDVQFCDYAAIFIDRENIPPKEGAEEDFEIEFGDECGGESFIESPLTPEQVKACSARTESDRMVVTDRDVYWECFPENRDWRVETWPIPLDYLRELLAKADKSVSRHPGPDSPWPVETENWYEIEWFDGSGWNRDSNSTYDSIEVTTERLREVARVDLPFRGVKVTQTREAFVK